MAKKGVISTYHKILKKFTKVNNALPEDRKIPLSERRRIIKESLYPKYKDLPKYKIRIKDIGKKIIAEYQKLPPKEICDLNYIDPSEYAAVNWFELDDFIGNVMPRCIYIKVSAGSFGETRIFNNSTYDYVRSGVHAIVESIRAYDNGKSGIIFSGSQKVRPKKENDGTPENYYLDMIITIGGAPQGDTTEVKFEVKDTKRVSKKKKIKGIINERVAGLKAAKQRKKRARATLTRNVKKTREQKKKINKNKRVSPERRKTYVKQLSKTLKLLEKYFKQGKISKENYESNKKIILMEKGGMI